MSATGLEVFDKTLQTTNTWLDEIMQRIGPDRHLAWHVLGAVLRTLRDRVPLGLAAHFGAQLPLLVRGLYYDQFHPSEEPQRWRTRDEFFALIHTELRGTRPVNVIDAVQAVFQTVNHFIDPGQVAKLRSALPEDVRDLWAETGPAAAPHAAAPGGHAARE